MCATFGDASLRAQISRAASPDDGPSWHGSVVAMRAAGLPDRMVAAWHGHCERVMVETYDHADLDVAGLAAVGQMLAALRGAVDE